MIFTQACGKVMFSVVFICQSVYRREPHVTIHEPVQTYSLQDPTSEPRLIQPLPPTCKLCYSYMKVIGLQLKGLLVLNKNTRYQWTVGNRFCFTSKSISLSRVRSHKVDLLFDDSSSQEGRFLCLICLESFLGEFDCKVWTLSYPVHF